LIYPIGFLCGAEYPEVATEPDGYRLRIGDRDVRLTTYSECLAWSCAHGASKQEEAEPVAGWSRRDAEDFARKAAGVNISAIMSRLLSAGVLEEVLIGSPDALDFTRRRRLRPLLTVLAHHEDLSKNSAQEREHLFGMLSRSAIARVAYQLWKHAALYSSLAALCESLISRGGPLERADWPDCEDLLPLALLGTQTLLACQGAYLDLAE